MRTDFRALCAELLDEFVYHTDWSDGEELKARARAALAEPADGPAALAEGPSDEELRDLWSWAAGQDQGPWPTQQHAFARAVLARWGQPPAPPAEGEVAELVRWLRLRNPIDMEGEPDDCTYFMLTRAAELLERHAAPVPVPVTERLPGLEDCAPWPGDPNPSHWCWVGRDVDGGWEWQQRSEDCLLVFDEDWWTHWLPAHALPLPAPQGGEAQP